MSILCLERGLSGKMAFFLFHMLYSFITLCHFTQDRVFLVRNWVQYGHLVILLRDERWFVVTSCNTVTTLFS